MSGMLDARGAFIDRIGIVARPGSRRAGAADGEGRELSTSAVVLPTISWLGNPNQSARKDSTQPATNSADIATTQALRARPYAQVQTLKRNVIRALGATLLLTAGCQKTLPVVNDEGSAGGGATGTTSSGVQAGDKGKIVARAVADIAPFGTGTLSGQITFEQDASGGVSGASKVMNCEEGKTYYMFVREGHACDSEASIGQSWSQDSDGAFTSCFQGVFDALAVHIAQASLPSDWSIGGSSKTDLIGHAVVVTLDDENTSRSTDLGCGVIRKAN